MPDQKKQAPQCRGRASKGSPGVSETAKGPLASGQKSPFFLQGYLAHKKRQPHGTLRLWPYGGPRGLAVSYERGTPVGVRAMKKKRGGTPLGHRILPLSHPPLSFSHERQSIPDSGLDSGFQARFWLSGPSPQNFFPEKCRQVTYKCF